MEYKKGDILACWDNSIISKIIRYITKSGVSHIAIMYDDALVMESNWNGVRIIKLSDLQKRLNFHVLRTYLTENESKNIIKYLQNSFKSKYDYIQLITVGLHRIFGFKIKDNNKKYICSELAWEAYDSIGIDIAPQVDEADDVTPGDLLTALNLKWVYMHVLKK